MAKSTPHKYLVPKTHPIACKMKKGGLMKVTMSRTGDEPDDQGNYEMAEESAESVTPGAPTAPPGSKEKKYLKHLKENRRVVT